VHHLGFHPNCSHRCYQIMSHGREKMFSKFSFALEGFSIFSLLLYIGGTSDPLDYVFPFVVNGICAYEVPTGDSVFSNESNFSFEGDASLD
jgi:hypothetical protein